MTHRLWYRLPAVALLVLASIGSVRICQAEPVVSSTAPITAVDAELTSRWQSEIQPLLATHCLDCHQGDTAESAVDLASYTDLESVRRVPSLWEQIRGVIRLGAMPPKDHDVQPTDEQRQQLAEWIHRALNEVDCTQPRPATPITVRRLNRVEYDQTIRDLFGVDITPSKEIGFVSDDVGNGFDNQGEVLSVSPLVFEKYVQSAEWISTKVLNLDPDALRKQTAEIEPLTAGESNHGSFLCAAGKYEIKLRIGLGNDFGDDTKGRANVSVSLDGEPLQTVEVVDKSETFSWERELTEGAHRVEIVFNEHTIDNPSDDKTRGTFRKLFIRFLRLEGPDNGTPPRPQAYQALMVSEPSETVSVDEAARTNMARLLPRAFRRPVTAEEIDRYVQVARRATEQGWGFGEAMQFCIQSILVSPDFLFRVEGPDAGAAAEHLAEAQPSDAGELSTAPALPTPDSSSDSALLRIDAHALASRLSYTLWSTMPDEALRAAADSGGLLENETLDAQLDRMLTDPRAMALVDGFFAQWLGLRNLNAIDVDEQSFTLWSTKLRDAMAEETRQFCAHLLRQGSLRDVLSADYTFVNPRLAEFYGIPYEGQDAAEMYINGSVRRGRFSSRRLGRYRDENRWIQVALPENRRGLLTQASILTLTSNPTRTSPVKRGKWVLDNILGDPPPPAPPGVPSLEKSGEGQADLTLRERLELHRADPGCASCHKVLDPIGLGLENFDAIGRYREQDGTKPIDAQGELADGRTFTGSRELLQHLDSEQEKVARHFASKLLTYALGRGLNRYDQCTIDAIVSQARADDYRVRAFVRAVVLSDAFRTR